ncbi:MAG: LTA synthase family protein [Candidatus Parcubacteria bacterium]|nr:LTA synthase family protein [Candidatus Parcubacteria bacterium]
MKRISLPFSALCLPAVLAGLFVVQNEIFNLFVHFPANPYLFQFVFITFSLGMILYGPSALFPRIGRVIYLSIISLFVALLFISQALYFSYFGGFMQASAFTYADQTGAIKSTIVTLIKPILIIFLLHFFVIALWMFLEKKGRITKTVLIKTEKIGLILFLVFTSLFSYGLILFGDGNGWKKVTNFSQTLHEMNSFTFSPTDKVERTGIFNYYASDIVGFVFRKTKLTEEDIALVQAWKQNIQEAGKSKYFGTAKGKNLIIVQFESLENVVLFQKINGQEITPNLNQLAKEGLYFDNYYTQVGPGNTADAEFVTMNSLYALPNTVAFVDFAHNHYNALPELLKQNGYRTYSLHADVPTFWNRSNIYPELGYETSITKSDFVIPENSGFEMLSDEEFFTQSWSKMKDFPSPFMATFITLSSHTPFLIPEKDQTLIFPENSPFNETQKNYLQSIHYSDQALGKFIKALKENGEYEKSLIAIYGDHGSLTGLGNILGTSESKVFPELRSSVEGSVPLIILGTSLPEKTYEIPGSHLDFYPTIANLLGVTPKAALMGQDLLGKNHQVTIRDSYSRAITAILTPTIAYKNFNEEGTFETGTCLKMPEQKTAPLADCKNIYMKETAATNASDLVIKGNLASTLLFGK